MNKKKRPTKTKSWNNQKGRQPNLPHQHKDVKVLLPAPEHLLSTTSTLSQEKLGRVDNHRLLTQSGSKQKQLWNKQRTNVQSVVQVKLHIIGNYWWKTNTRLTLFMSKCLSKGSCFILFGKFPSKLATTFHPSPWKKWKSSKIWMHGKNFKNPNYFLFFGFWLVKEDTLQFNSCCVWVNIGQDNIANEVHIWNIMLT